MPKPSFDSSNGWWSIRVTMPDGTRTKVQLARQENWRKGRAAPKKVPPEVEVMARPYLDMAVQAKHGADVSVVRATPLRPFLAEYREYHSLVRRPNSVKNLANAVAHFLAHCDRCGVKTVQGATAAVCESFLVESLKSGLARSSVVVFRGYLAGAWSRAERTRKVASNPWKGAPTPGKAKQAAAAFWTREELARLVDACEGWVKDVVVVAANSGPRIESLLNLRWDAVHWARGVVRYDSKTGSYEVPMNVAVRDVLQRRAATGKGSGLVFPADRSDTVKPCVAFQSIRRAVRKAGLPEKGRYCHLLRHTFASHAVMSGVPLTTVSKWLGHRSIKTTMVYAHLAESESQRQMDTFSLGVAPDTTSQPPHG